MSILKTNTHIQTIVLLVIVIFSLLMYVVNYYEMWSKPKYVIWNILRKEIFIESIQASNIDSNYLSINVP